MNLVDRYLGEIINYGGEFMSRGEAIADMQRIGMEPRCIDRWLQGNELMARLRSEEQTTASSHSTPAKDVTFKKAPRSRPATAVNLSLPLSVESEE
jgi:hypothetical protein